MKSISLFVTACISAAAAASESTPEWLSAQSGGDATIAISNENAYARALPTLPPEDLRKFTFGNRLFNTNWVAAPASVQAFDGLGPVFNRVSCSACHTRDGRGRPPETEGAPLESMLVRMSIPGTSEHGAVRPVPHYGDQLNEKALPGVPSEGRTVVSFTEKRGTYPDGAEYSLQVPHYRIEDLAFGALPPKTMLSARVAPPVFGLALLEAVPDAQILAHEDPRDADGDGVSGRANHVWDAINSRVALGRFGWKANQPSLRQQNAAAANGDIGITSSIFPKDNVADGQSAAAAAVKAVASARLTNGGGAPSRAPEMKDEFFAKLTFYVQTLAVPAARHVDDAVVRQGAALFAQARCTSCHLPTMKTGEYPDVPELANQTIHPFTDLLLHDMGPELGDGRPDFAATGAEWRTAPLWGIGLTEAVNRHTRFLHDGRARSLEEAVLWHDGEARGARDRFLHMSRDQRQALLQFLNDL